MCDHHPNAENHYLMVLEPDVFGNTYGLKLRCDGGAEYTGGYEPDEQTAALWHTLGWSLQQMYQVGQFGNASAYIPPTSIDRPRQTVSIKNVIEVYMRPRYMYGEAAGDADIPIQPEELVIGFRALASRMVANEVSRKANEEGYTIVHGGREGFTLCGFPIWNMPGEDRWLHLEEWQEPVENWRPPGGSNWDARKPRVCEKCGDALRGMKLRRLNEEG